MSIESDNLAICTKDELIDIIKTNLEGKKSLEYLLDNLSGISWEFNLVANSFTYVSQSAKRLLGYEIDEWKDLNSWASMIYEEDRQKTTEYCSTQTQNGLNHVMEYRMVKKSGEVIWIFDVVRLGKDEKGNPEKLFGFIIDINEQKEKQLELEKEHKFLQKVINGISDPVMIINADMTVSLMNDAVKNSLEGKRFKDPANPKCYEVIYNRDCMCDGEDLPCPLKNVLSSGVKSKVMHKSQDENGKTRYLEIAASPLFDENNQCTSIIETERDITEYIELTNELQEKTEMLKHQAHYDYLTGLPNRALFMDRLIQGVKDTKRSKRAMALFFMDLDYFKEINDTYGHQMGDAVLKEVCKRFKVNTRENDILSRLGGDEFTVILKDIKSRKDIIVIAQKFLDIFKEPLVIDGKSLKLSASIGISTYVGENITPEQLLNDADTAMYESKEKGKNTFEFFEKESFRYSETT